VDDEEPGVTIDRLRRRFSEASARRAAILSEAKEFAARIGDVREALGNPYFYSGGNYGRPENADESIANFTGYQSHEPALRLVHRLRDADREVSTLREQLQELGVDVEKGGT
jgi:hypothetical protein